MKKLLLATTAVVLAVSPALAADLGGRGPRLITGRRSRNRCSTGPDSMSAAMPAGAGAVRWEPIRADI
jgi:hypothetical protein